MDYETFKERISGLDTVYSVQGKVPYRICMVKDGIVTIRRESTGNSVNIKLDELYEFYKKERIYTTTKAREYISGRTFSPAVAILMTLTEKTNG